MQQNKVLNNRYDLLQVIGTGGMAKVYKAQDRFLNREVAIKIINPLSPLDDLIKERFLQEIKAVSRIRHPNVILIYDVFIDKKDWCLVFELLQGKTLKEYLLNNSFLGVKEVVTIMNEILRGVQACHNVGIIHRDLKPENIILTTKGAIKVLDFGIAIIDDYEIKKYANQIVGTMKYIAPEVVTFQKPTIQSDIYALGIILYELLIGKPPFFHKNLQTLAAKHLKEAIPLVTRINKNIPQTLENIILKATCKDNNNRYQNISEFAKDLTTCLDISRRKEKPLYKKPLFAFKKQFLKMNAEKMEQPFYLKKWFLILLLLLIITIIISIILFLLLW